LGQYVGKESLENVYTFFGAECLHHLSRVACGLDSIFIGESEIQGQVRAAYNRVPKDQLSGELHFAFQRALHTGKIIRNKLPVANEDVCSHVFAAVDRYLRSVSSPSVLCVGASSINSKIAKLLSASSYRVVVANRTQERALKLASSIGGDVLPWEELEKWTTFPCVICATRCPYYLLPDGVPSSSQLLVDLGLPRNIDPQLSSSTRTLLNIESFAPTRQQKVHEIERCISSRVTHEYDVLCRKAERIDCVGN
jgi:glutamyl-tRNA reductase